MWRGDPPFFAHSSSFVVRANILRCGGVFLGVQNRRISGDVCAGKIFYTF